ncbi:MAG: hypothetical protein ABW168_13975 [Sedimenticola sp.]
MWLYYSFYPYGKKNTFSIGGRANEIFSKINIHEHRRNYSVHKGIGTRRPAEDSYQARAIKAGDAVQTLRHAHQVTSPYIEVVWNQPGSLPGVTRLIVNKNDFNEIYFTDNHYTVYWKIWAAQNTHTVFKKKTQ